MTDLPDSAEVEARAPEGLGIGVSVRNFGPIGQGTVELRPLTVFVGPSNTGKTYFAILIYALRGVMGGFPRFPVVNPFRHPFFALDTNLSGRQAVMEEWELLDVQTKLNATGRPFNFSDFPESVVETALITLGNPDSLGMLVGDELIRCFDLESISDLVRFAAGTAWSLELTASEASQRLWRFGMDVTGSDIVTDGQIEDIGILPEGWSAEDSRIKTGMLRYKEFIEEVRGPDKMLDGNAFLDFFDEHFARDVSLRGDTLFMPAARSGIMQSHRVIASTLVARSTRGGLERLPEIPTLSGLAADFMRWLILYEQGHSHRASLDEAADVLEREALDGQIRAVRPLAGGYPDFVYRPSETDEEIRLTRASSMVSELAPVVLFLRGAVSAGDMLIIEEPEAHLHPDAQTQMARILARLVRAGVRVVVTTHSDWLLMEIANLMREGELEELGGEGKGEAFPADVLRPSEVAVWLFQKNEASTGSTIKEIPFDRSEGVGPEEFEEVAEELYNRSAALQNRLQEVKGADASEQE